MRIGGMLRIIAAIARNNPGPLVRLPVRMQKVALDVLYDVYAVDARAGLSAAQCAAILDIVDTVARDGYNVILGFLLGNTEERKADYVVILAGKRGGGSHPRLENAVATGFMQKWTGERFNEFLHELFGIQPQELFVLRGV